MTTEYRATAETARTVTESTAAAARALFEGLYPDESWDELIGMADKQDLTALARQGVFMRAARFALDAYARRVAGIVHRNPMSLAERERSAAAWIGIVVEPKIVALREASRIAAIHIERIDVPVSRAVATGGRGAVAAMIRDYSRALVRLSSVAG